VRNLTKIICGGAFAAAVVITATITPAIAQEAKPSAGQKADGGVVTKMEEMVVTGAREEELKSETPLAVGSVKQDDIAEARPQHPSAIMGRIPGVMVNVTGGEGHMTSIRQPITTNPVYLYLEDGIPVRSTGFFNHNALYEVNIPQSGGVEIIKGPGTALYGSDAIGGVINVLTRRSPDKAEAEAALELGGSGWRRLLLSGGSPIGEGNGVRADLNSTHSDGWRDSTKYDRQSGAFRWDMDSQGGATLKTALAYSNIDQQTAGTSAISYDDYKNNPTANYTPISFRKVTALRISSAYEKEMGDTLLSLTPYARVDSMEIIPNWSLSYDPQRYTTSNNSLGLQAKYRVDFNPARTRVIVGADIDHSPGKYNEDKLTVGKTDKIYTSYEIASKSYDYADTYQGISPYLHTEFSPTERLRFNLGVRYDNMSYDYTNNLSTVTEGFKRRPASAVVTFSDTSPKAGLTYQVTDEISGFMSYRHAFRAPSDGQLFRQGQALDTVGLKPIKADSYDLGLRGESGKFGWEITAYSMTKKDDILTYTNTADKTTEATNAGETLHRGIEAGVHAKLTDNAGFEMAYCVSRHTYEKWSPKTGVDYSGKEMSSAPSEVANARLYIRPSFMGGGRAEAEFVRVGSYWMDDDNTHKYPGHNLLNVSATWRSGNNLELYGRVANVTDERYSESTAYTQAGGETYAPGMARTFFVGLQYRMF
jgi:outer membrane receptor protein involved in Fe transport